MTRKDYVKLAAALAAARKELNTAHGTLSHSMGGTHCQHLG